MIFITEYFKKNAKIEINYSDSTAIRDKVDNFFSFIKYMLINICIFIAKFR